MRAIRSQVSSLQQNGLRFGIVNIRGNWNSLMGGCTALVMSSILLRRVIDTDHGFFSHSHTPLQTNRNTLLQLRTIWPATIGGRPHSLGYWTAATNELGLVVV